MVPKWLRRVICAVVGHTEPFNDNFDVPFVAILGGGFIPTDPKWICRRCGKEIK